MASKVKKKQNLQGLTEQQKHIIKYRNKYCSIWENYGIL